jgi:hypothetical protein
MTKALSLARALVGGSRDSVDFKESLLLAKALLVGGSRDSVDFKESLLLAKALVEVDLDESRTVLAKARIETSLSIYKGAIDRIHGYLVRGDDVAALKLIETVRASWPAS